jgi:hypothetical protein
MIKHINLTLFVFLGVVCFVELYRRLITIVLEAILEGLARI